MRVAWHPSWWWNWCVPEDEKKVTEKLWVQAFFLSDDQIQIFFLLKRNKWTYERMGKASDEVINKTYAEYKQRELNEKGEKTGKALGRHVINLYATRISRQVKIRNVHKLCQDIENDLIIKDQMANLGCLLVDTFGKLLAPVLGVSHTVNNLDLGNELENEGYKSD